MTMAYDYDEGNADGTDRRGAQLKVERCRDAIFKYGVSFFCEVKLQKLWL